MYFFVIIYSNKLIDEMIILIILKEKSKTDKNTVSLSVENITEAVISIGERESESVKFFVSIYE